MENSFKIFGVRVEYYNSEGKFHREDGPAVEWYDRENSFIFDNDYNSGNYWYLNGIFIFESEFIKSLTNQAPNPNLFKDLPIDRLEDLVIDLSDEYIATIHKRENFYCIYFKENLDPNDPDLKSFENRINDFRIRVNNKSILVW